jgi:class 3 adenylate cyclase
VSFLETVDRARTFLERHRRVSLRALRREFALDAETLAELSEELVQVQRVAVLEGDVLVWAGAETRTVPPTGIPPPTTDPRSYTPKHLAEKILTSRSSLEGERKQVTVLFADLKGSMDLGEKVDPEEWYRIMDRFFQILSDGVHRFEGTVDKFTGDGIMAIFGAPIAHEDHARRACYAALHLRDELRRYAEELKRTRGLSFSVRMGLNSGEVVVETIGDDLKMVYTAHGNTVGLGQSLKHAARSLSETTPSRSSTAQKRPPRCRYSAAAAASWSAVIAPRRTSSSPSRGSFAAGIDPEAVGAIAGVRAALFSVASEGAGLFALPAAVMNSSKRLRSAAEMSTNSTAIPSSQIDCLTRPVHDTLNMPRWSVRAMRLPIGSGSRSSSMAPPRLRSRKRAVPPGNDA